MDGRLYVKTTRFDEQTGFYAHGCANTRSIRRSARSTGSVRRGKLEQMAEIQDCNFELLGHRFLDGFGTRWFFSNHPPHYGPSDSMSQPSSDHPNSCGSLLRSTIMGSGERRVREHGRLMVIRIRSSLTPKPTDFLQSPRWSGVQHRKGG